MRWNGYLSTVLFLLFFIVLPVLWVGAEGELPYLEKVKDRFGSSDSLLLDRQGRLLHELRTDETVRRLRWTELEDISPALIEIAIHAEDHRFFRHSGVDWIAIAGSVVQTLSGHPRGASTITMQLASMIRPELQPSRGRRSLSKKLGQMRAALHLERRWSKEEILEAYLNLVYFRGELQGVRSASWGLFGKAPNGLDRPEAAILAALIRSPNASMDAVKARADFLISGLYGDRRSESTSLAATRKESQLQDGYFIPRRVRLAPHVARRLLSVRDDEHHDVVQSTLDRDLQRYALESLREHLQMLLSRNARDGAVLAVENRTGDILAYLGNADDFSSARFVDGIQAYRQAGSTLKPFLYATAFERKLLTPASLLDDSPTEIPVVGGTYRPSNYDNLFRGPVTTRVALASSLNVPAVRVLTMVGEEDFVRRLGALGFTRLRDADYYGPALALGSADIRLYDLVNAYRTLANQGIWSPIGMEPVASARLNSPSARPVFTAESAFVVSHILSDRESRSATFSLESPLSTAFWSAVKTGTSKDMRDNWCVGFSSNYTVGVWVGNFTGEPMWNVSGISGAAPVWVEIMQYLHRQRKGGSPPVPLGVEKNLVRFSTGQRTREEWFLKGTAVSEVEVVDETRPARIVYPPDGTIILMDPEIPETHQRVFFESANQASDLNWQVNGKRLGKVEGLFSWAPRPGLYRLQLVDSGDRVRDEVTFQVRGPGSDLGTEDTGLPAHKR